MTTLRQFRDKNKKFCSYRILQRRRWPQFSLSSGVLVRVQMFGAWLLGADTPVLSLRTAGILVDGPALWPGDAVRGPGKELQSPVLVAGWGPGELS